MANLFQPTRITLKRLLNSLLLLLFFSFTTFSQNVGINSTGTAPNASAGLDVDFPDKGVLIPRVSLTGTNNFTPLTAHVAGMIVYNTVSAADVTPGFYYNNGSRWIPGFPGGNSVGDMVYWNGSAWLMLPIGQPGQYLQISGGNIPVWGGTGLSAATMTTATASAIAGISATSGGNITNDGGSAVLSRGVCWNTSPGPTIANSKTTDGTGAGVYTSSLTSLLPATTYYIRAYAMNSNIISYGNETSFTTTAVIPTLATTTAASAITGTTANSGGNITSTGGAPILERGICYATTANPTIAGTKIIDPAPGPGLFVSNLISLTGYTTYYVRAYATNSAGTAYGTQITFTTLRIPPTLLTVGATSISGASAASGGSMTWNGGGYSNYQAYGVAYSTTPNSATPTKVATNGSNFPYTTPIAPWVTNIAGLAANTTYYIRSYLDIYPSGTGPWTTIYGNELSFTTTAPTAPVVASTTSGTVISANAANSGGAITSDGGSAITAKGVCWSTSPAPILGAGNFTTNGTGAASFISNITGLTGNTLYYVRAYATNSIGTSYGPADITFTTWVQAPYTLGQNLGYGWCAYVAPDGTGFIVSNDIPSTIGWGCPAVHLAVGTALGTGKANTDLIIATCGTSTAAGVARAYNGGGFNDWFLPSSGEWAKIASVYSQIGLSGHSANNFYTSSEYNTNYNYAATYFINGSTPYGSGAQRVPGVNDYINSLRAIRTF